MVLLSDPAAIRELYAASEHGLPPGRTVALRPIMGERSILLLEGAAHLRAPAADAAAVPRRADALLRGGDRADHAARRSTRWPRGSAFALHPRMRAITFEVILAVVFGVTDARRAQRLRELLPRLLDGTSSPVLSFRVLLARRLGRRDPLEAFAALAARDRRAAARRHRGKAGFARGRGRPLAAARRALRGRKRDERPGAARPAGDAAARRPRDDRDRARVDVRPADALARHAAAADRRARGGRRAMAARGDRRVAAVAAGPAAGGAPPRVGASHGRLHAAAGNRRVARRSG